MALSQQMDAERWRRISELYYRAAAHEEKDRAAFLAEGCAGDEALRREVQSLLDAPSTGEGLLPGRLPAIPQMTNDPSAPAITGQRLTTFQPGAPTDRSSITCPVISTCSLSRQVICSQTARCHDPSGYFAPALGALLEVCP
jgi:hypothetical protein